MLMGIKLFFFSCMVSGGLATVEFFTVGQLLDQCHLTVLWFTLFSFSFLPKPFSPPDHEEQFQQADFFFLFLFYFWFSFFLF